MNVKVLVVDDNLESAKTLQWLMEAAGHDVRIATNGMTAFHKINDFIPDVVLSDLSMPKVNGYEMCKKMKRDGRLKSTLFIAQSGLSSPTAKLLSSKAGFNHHLVKPIDAQQLLHLIAKNTQPTTEV